MFFAIQRLVTLPGILKMDENHVQNTEIVENNTVAESSANGNIEVAENDQQPAQAPAQRPGGWAMFKTLLVRMFFIYMISSFFRRGSNQQSGQQEDGVKQGPAMSASNIYYKDLLMDLYVYVSEEEHFKDFGNQNSLFWMEEELSYGDWTSGFNGDGSFEKFGVLDISENVMNNGSIYLHVYFVKSGKSPNPADDHFDDKTRVYSTKRLNKYKKRKFHTTVNLLTGTTDAHPDLIKKDNNETTVEILSHWHPNLTINMVEDYTPWQRGSIPAPLDEYIKFTESGIGYYPILYLNDYWNLNQHYMPINETTPKLNLSLTYNPMSLFKWQMYAAQGMRNKWYSVLGEDFTEDSDDDQDSLKTTLVETNPYLLAVTIIVSLVHSVFEFLAFKNDIQFWKNKKSLEGLSVRSVFFNVFQSLIVLLYVLDNETNFIVKCSVFIGLFIELWKITKVMDIKLNREDMILGFIPRIAFSDKATYVESETKKYDKLAFKYLSWVLFPLLGGYAVYSIIYHEHKGWYSWVLNILYGFLLMFGFIMMTPQLFINYKLKSVAHLPWRMMTYKALNTFIDDLFAFVIKMPILYRIGCFRDDIVFIIFLYQRYIYPVDKTRVNEFGISGETLEEIENKGQSLEQNNEIEDAPAANGDIGDSSAGSSSVKPKSEKQKKTD